MTPITEDTEFLSESPLDGASDVLVLTQQSQRSQLKVAQKKELSAQLKIYENFQFSSLVEEQENKVNKIYVKLIWKIHLQIPKWIQVQN